MKSLLIKFFALALALALPFTSYADTEPDRPAEYDRMMKYGGTPRVGMGLMRQYMGNHPYRDKMFLSGMIPHHEGAITMAQEVLKNGKDPQVKQWAEEVIRAQTSEIKDMRGWLEAMGGHDTEFTNWMNGTMHGMMLSFMNADPDRNFVEMMIRHHGLALEMAIVSLEESSDLNILRLSKDIITAQADEIYAYKQWLLKKQ